MSLKGLAFSSALLAAAYAFTAEAETETQSLSEPSQVSQENPQIIEPESISGSIKPTLSIENIENFADVPHTLIIQDPLLGTMGSSPGMSGTACFNAAFDLANYSDKQTACLNETTGFMSVSYDF